MFLGINLENCIQIQDECHNLIEVATDVNSERILPYYLTNCISDLNSYNGEEIYKNLARNLQKSFNSIKKKIKEGEAYIDPASFLNSLIKTIGLNDMYEFWIKIGFGIQRKLSNKIILDFNAGPCYYFATTTLVPLHLSLKIGFGF